MSKPVKKTDRDKPWFRGTGTYSRPRASRPERRYILIVCEGTKTEPGYFASMEKLLPRHVVSLEIVGEAVSPRGLVENALRRREERRRSMNPPFDEVWVVFDKDEIPPADFDNAIHQAASSKIQCAWSNEAFELWYILHFEYRNTPMNRSEYGRRLETLIGEPYRKNDQSMYENLQKRGGSQNVAIENSKKLHLHFSEQGIPPSSSNPCTAVYRLVQTLIALK